MQGQVSEDDAVVIGPNRFVENAVGGNVASSAMMHWGYNYIATLIW